MHCILEMDMLFGPFLPNLRKYETCENPVALNMYQWQVPHHHAMDENPTVLVVGSCGNQIDALGILSFVDTYLGKKLNSLGLTHSIVDVIALPFANSTEKRLHLIVDVVKNIPGFPALVLGVKDKALTEWELQPAYYYQSKDECEYLIKLASPHMKKLKVIDEKTGKNKDSRVRTSSGTFLPRGRDTIIRVVEQRIANFTFLPVEGDETVFPSAKGNFSDVPYWNELSKCGQEGLAVKPKMGDALFFWSLKPDASLDPSSLHSHFSLSWNFLIWSFMCCGFSVSLILNLQSFMCRGFSSFIDFESAV
ncbi:hypothetical protein BVRB_2g041520 [Beta vulgaris subsp. vulgaris]|nr:hypothetical protein BVRB_2g041520 [Beta vulgaris subsp. vulgaris]